MDVEKLERLAADAMSLDFVEENRYSHVVVYKKKIIGCGTKSTLTYHFQEVIDKIEILTVNQYKKKYE